ncbi:unnamed protein product, partial [Mesorhabditis spiculigera]
MASASYDSSFDEAYLAAWWDCPGDCTTEKQKLNAIKEQYSPPGSQTGILSVQAGAPAHAREVTRFPVKEAKARLERLAKEETTSAAFNSPADLHVPFPVMFDVTGDILDSDAHQGLLHTVLRHSSDWKVACPKYKSTYAKLSDDSRRRIDTIGAFDHHQYEQAKQHAVDFMQYIKSAPHTSDCKVLYRLQKRIYDYLLRKAVDGHKYRGEGKSNSGRTWIFFHVEKAEKKSEVEYMVICPSKECTLSMIFMLQSPSSVSSQFFSSTKRLTMPAGSLKHLGHLRSKCDNTE